MPQHRYHPTKAGPVRTVAQPCAFAWRLVNAGNGSGAPCPDCVRPRPQHSSGEHPLSALGHETVALTAGPARATARAVAGTARVSARACCRPGSRAAGQGEHDERWTPVRGLGHAHHGAARSLRALPRSEVPAARHPARSAPTASRSAAPRRKRSSTACPAPATPTCSSTASGSKPGGTQSTQPLSGSRLADTGRLDFAIKRNYDPEAQVMGMEMEGVDIAVLYPTTGLCSSAATTWIPSSRWPSARPTTTGSPSSAGYSPEQLKFVAMLPMHDVHLACRELVRGVRELGAIGSFVRPNLVNGHYWHSNYWDPLYTMHEDLNVTWGFHEGTGALVLAHERALRREPLLPPRGQPLDRDAAGADRHDHRRRLRVPSQAPGRIPGGPELLGARAPVAHRVGLPPVPRHPRAVPVDDAARVLPAQLLGRRRGQRARDRGHRRPHRRRPHVHLHRLSALRLQLPHVSRT